MENGQQSQNQYGHLSHVSARLYTFFLPLNYNNGQQIQGGKVTWALNEIVRYTGGLTKFAPGIGLWVSPNAVVYRDRVLPIQVVTPPDKQTELWFSRFAAQLALVLEQECIFLVAQPLWLMDEPVSASEEIK